MKERFWRRDAALAESDDEGEEGEEGDGGSESNDSWYDQNDDFIDDSELVDDDE